MQLSLSTSDKFGCSAMSQCNTMKLFVSMYNNWHGQLFFADIIQDPGFDQETNADQSRVCVSYSRALTAAVECHFVRLRSPILIAM